ncbi:MAG: hypothetical protein MUO38_13415, partial [Anaerolineales bacterium]|nr:hypothetical protein [Anaerolineales bacterium]
MMISPWSDTIHGSTEPSGVQPLSEPALLQDDDTIRETGPQVLQLRLPSWQPAHAVRDLVF